MVLDALSTRYGHQFARVLSISSVLVDGSPVLRGAEVELPDGAELALLPPVSGGAGQPGLPGDWESRNETMDFPLPPAPPGQVATSTTSAPPPTPPPSETSRVRARLAVAAEALPRDPIAAAALPVALAAACLAGLLGGRDAFAFAVLAGSALALIDLVVLMDRGIARPAAPVVAIPGLALPTVLAFDPTVGWEVATSLVVGAVLAAFGCMLVGGRRWGVVDGLGLTLLAGLVIGFGASALILLRSLPGGVRVAAVLVALVVMADLAAAIARLAGATGRMTAAAPALGAALPALIFFTIVGGTPSVALALLVVTAAVAVRNGWALTAALRSEGRLEPRPRFLPRGLLGDGMIFSAIDALLLAAPVAYVVVRAAG